MTRLWNLSTFKKKPVHLHIVVKSVWFRIRSLGVSAALIRVLKCAIHVQCFQSNDPNSMRVFVYLVGLCQFHAPTVVWGTRAGERAATEKPTAQRRTVRPGTLLIDTNEQELLLRSSPHTISAERKFSHQWGLSYRIISSNISYGRLEISDCQRTWLRCTRSAPELRSHSNQTARTERTHRTSLSLSL